MNNKPLQDLAFNQRSDFVTAARRLVEPLLPHFTRGRTGVFLGRSGVSFGDTAEGFEGFSRPLYGLVPLAMGGEAWDHWDLWQQGLINGSDPDHPEYWGKCKTDQRMVEMAAIGLALMAVPEDVWNPLPETARMNLTRWLLQINKAPTVANNWNFFRVLTNLGLKRVGAEFDNSASEESFRLLEGYYQGQGWYTDGVGPRLDYYVPMAFHFYSLLYTRFADDFDHARCERFKERAVDFAQDFQYWFAADGAAVPFGRSLTYRFAQGAFWGGLVMANVEALPWSQVRALYAQHLRWWKDKPIAGRDGVLSIGYGYENLLMSEEYNSSGSPYWCMKFFAALAQPDSHPFWRAHEVEVQPTVAPIAQRYPGFIVSRDEQQVQVLSSGQENTQLRQAVPKYCKFAYSSRFGFSVESDRRQIVHGAYDSMLAVRFPKGSWEVRSTLLEHGWVHARGFDMLRATWSPLPGVLITTLLWGHAPWHVRVHHIDCEHRIDLAEGGFSLPWEGTDGEQQVTERTAAPQLAQAENTFGVSLIRGLMGEGSGQVVVAAPNTNLIWPRTLIPTLRYTLSPGTHTLACQVIAGDAAAVTLAEGLVPDLAPALSVLN